MSQAKLFADFQKSSAKEWQQQIEQELKGKPYDQLRTKTPAGIEINPFYHQDLSAKLRVNLPNPIQQINEALPPRYWANQAKIKVQDEQSANKEALTLLNTGAEGVIFVVSHAQVNFEKLLKDIQIEYCMLSFESEEPFYSLVSDYLRFIKTKGIDSSKISGFYHCDIIECRDAGTIGLNEKDFESIASLIAHADDYPGFKPLCISSQLLHNAGANNIHEIALLWAKTVEFFDKLTDLDLTVAQIIHSTAFSIPFGRNFFLEMVKAKTFKAGLLKIGYAYESDFTADDIFIHATTSFRSKSALDYNVNLLRNTTEAMAAVLGGCNSLWVQAHDETAGKKPKATYKRTALNISNILKEEAHLDKIVDPTLGSYFLENMIASMEAKAWKVFLDLENDDTYSEHFESGQIHQIIGTDEAKAEKALWERKDVSIGSNTFQLIGETLEEIPDDPSEGKSLSPKRLTATIERLRGRVETVVQQKGESARPMADILLLGTDAVSKAKSDFAYSFLGTAGIGIRSEKIISNLDEVTIENNTAFTVLCYQNRPSDLADFLSRNPSARILIAGQEEDEETLKKQGLYACIHRNLNTKHFLHELLTDLGIK